MRRLRSVLRVLLPVLIVVLAAIATKTIVESREAPVPRPPDTTLPLVTTLRAEAEPVTLSVEAQGTVLPRTETVLKSEVSARVLEISPALASGGFFEEGEVLLVLDPTDYQVALGEARAGVARATTRLAREEADATVARRDWEALGAGSEPSELVLRIPQVAEARAELDAARARLAMAERDIERTRLRAPYRGRVRSREVDVGQYVERGAMLARVYAVDYAELRLPVPDTDLALLDLPLLLGGGLADGQGPAVLLSLRFARQEYRWEGHIVRTEGMVDPETRCVVLVARVEDPYGRGEAAERPPLLTGLFVDAVIEGRTLPSAVRLPREALRSNGTVFTLDDEDRLRIRPVDVVGGDRDTVVVAAGVEEGERVVVSPLELPVEGMALRDAGGRER